ncbi:hypothetical protein OHAE_635 [Ochrobactrum soli]|uniref:Uncharacterized protein n=1 Tax=Ochrobactrum soli TaxID=2448455 RepID=A0A2P9HKZ6_9HYPH|nr:hypothetical protein OHAE_635 [[Ochrobactrum] soli]
MPITANHGAGALIYVTDASTGAQLAYYDGSALRNVRTGILIS